MENIAEINRGKKRKMDIRKLIMATIGNNVTEKMEEKHKQLMISDTLLHKIKKAFGTCIVKG